MARKTVNATLARLFKFNEESDGHRLTDQQILEIVQHEHPSSAVTDLETIKRRRNQYNAGNGHFSSFGLPEQMSYEYDEDGNRIRPPSTVKTSKSTIDDSHIKTIVRETLASDEERIVNSLTARMTAIASEAKRPIVNIIVRDRVTCTFDTEFTHEKFEEVMLKVNAGLPVLLVGPSGSGKTHLAGQVARALGLRFTFNSMSEGVSEREVFGGLLPDKDGTLHFFDSPFTRSYREGGLHLFDELDSADPNLMTKSNAALSNGQLSLPVAGAEPVPMHEDFIAMAASNTYGLGASRQYVGRNQLDEATRNRYKMGTVEIDYDRRLERALASTLLEEPKPLLEWCWAIRDAINVNGLRHTMGTRNIIDSAKLLQVGADLDLVKSTFFLDWSRDDCARVEEVF